MATSKKDYVGVAAAIKLVVNSTIYNEAELAMARDACQSIACCVADYFAAANPQFDRARFLKACGVQS